MYVVWIPQWPGDIYAKSRRAALRTDDPRLQQFATPTLQLAKAFTDVLSWGRTAKRHASGPTPWDVHLLYGPDAVWEDTPTAPVHWYSPVVSDRELPKQLARLVQNP